MRDAVRRAVELDRLVERGDEVVGQAGVELVAEVEQLQADIVAGDLVVESVSAP